MTPLPKDVDAALGARLERMRRWLGERGVDGLLLTSPGNVRWASDFTAPDDARALITRDGAWLLTDARYTTQAESESYLPAIIDRDWVRRAADRFPGGSLAVEADHLTLARADALRGALDAVLEPVEAPLAPFRVVKDGLERRRLRRAAALTDTAMAAALRALRPGVREVDVALAAEAAMRDAGSEGMAFPTVVASGPRGALPHGVASDREIGAGELVTVDLGARFEGYCGDLTRTVSVGPPSEAHARLHAAVLEAQRAGLAALGPGRAAAEADRAARDVLRRHGLEDAFVHSLGHGVGLEVHEGPRLSQRSDDVLEPGMVVTVEPGVYRSGDAGVRIEDLVEITETGYEILSAAPKDAVFLER